VTTLCDRDLYRLQHDVPPGEGVRILPWKAELLQPCSYDLRLGSDFLVPYIKGRGPRSIRRADHRFPEYSAISTQSLCLRPGGFVLGATLETVTIGKWYRARLEGKSTIGRLGLMVHVTAGYIDPGFTGVITLELLNVAPYDIELVAGEPVCQLAVEHLSDCPEKLYGTAGLGSHYQGQLGVTAPKL